MDFIGFLKRLNKRLMGASMLALFLSFLTTIIMSRTIGSEGRGYFQLFVTFQSLMSPVLNLGLGTTYIYYCQFRKMFFNKTQILLVTLSTSTVISTLILSFYNDISIFSKIVCVLFITISSLNLVFIDILKLDKDLKGLPFSTIVPSVVLFLYVSILSVVGELNNDNVSYGLLLSSSVQLMSLLYCLVEFKYSQEKLKKINTKDEVISYLKYSSTILATLVFVCLSNNLDKIVVYSLLGVAELGKMSIALSFCAIANKISETMSINYMSNRVSDNNTEVLNFYSVFKAIIVIVFFISPACWFFGDFILPIIFGSDFNSMGFVFLILIANSLFSGFNSLVSQEFIVNGEPINNIYRTIISFLFFLVFSYLLRDEGLTGICTAILFSTIARAILSLNLLKNYEKNKI
ncbi:TPA: hypothetical protein I6204_003086 [Vibrio cholerae]|nr:hypothetical protein [Vibrio cholerae]